MDLKHKEKNMAFLNKKKYSRSGNYTGQKMYSQGGYREKNIMNNASFVVGSKNGRYIKFFAKHKKDGKFDSTKYDTATYSLKHNGWLN